MNYDATLQVRMNSELKSEVEELYRKLGMSFADAVRIFATQSLRDGGLPFTPSLRTMEDYSDDEVTRQLQRSQEDIKAGRVHPIESVDERMRGLLADE